MISSSVDYNTADYRPEGSNPFWPLLILMVGLSAYVIYQVLAAQDQLDSLTRAVAAIQPKVNQSQYDQNKLFNLAKDILRLAPTDKNAEQIAEEYNIRSTPAVQPGAPGSNDVPADARASKAP